jgi:hypothetical protein
MQKRRRRAKKKLHQRAWKPRQTKGSQQAWKLRQTKGNRPVRKPRPLVRKPQQRVKKLRRE